jgi:hypothetical protein
VNDPVELRILDAFQAGDRFEVTITSSTGERIELRTSVPRKAQYAPQVWADLEAAWTLEKYFTRCSTWLKPGRSYTIVVGILQTAKGSDGVELTFGNAAIRALTYSVDGLTMRSEPIESAMMSESDGSERTFGVAGEKPKGAYHQNGFVTGHAGKR